MRRFFTSFRRRRNLLTCRGMESTILMPVHFHIKWLLLSYALVDGITFDEVVFQNLVGPFPKLNSPLAFHPVTYRSHHFQVEILLFMGLGFILNCTMPSGVRKFCDFHFVCQFIFECFVDVLADGLIVPRERSILQGINEGRPLADIAKEWGLTERRVLQIYNRSILKTTDNV